MKNLLISSGAVIAIILIGYFAITRIPAPSAPEPAPQPQNQVLESLKGGVIYLESPRVEGKINSPLTVRGQARGPWFFEASFPLILTDWDGKIIAQSYAQAEGEWMTTDYVPFEGRITFENPSWDAEFSKRGTLILQKDNPSGLPEHDDAVEITVYFE